MKVQSVESNPVLAQLDEPLQDFFSGTVFGRYLCDHRLDRPTAVRHEIERLDAYSKEGQLRIALGAGGRVVGLIGFNFSQWDTDLLRKRMAIVRYFLVEERSLYKNLEAAKQLLSFFHAWVVENSIDVVVMRLDTNIQTPVLAVQQEGYRFFECANYLTLDELPASDQMEPGSSSRLATAADLPYIKEVAAKQFFRRSHFFLDPRFTTAQAESVYSRWVESAMEHGQTTLLYEEAGVVKGVFLFDMVDLATRFGKRFAVWKMAVLDAQTRGHGAGWRLFHSAIQSCLEHGADAIDSSYVVHNVASYNIHARLGFRLVNATYTFHKWFD